MKQTVVAIIPTDKVYCNIKDTSLFLTNAKSKGEILSLKEFETRFNADEINFGGVFIRILEAELEVIV